MKVSELEGAELDFWVAKAEQLLAPRIFSGSCRVNALLGFPSFSGIAGGVNYATFEPSINWSQGGPIIEKKKLALYPTVDGKWDSYIGCFGGWLCFQPTPLIAAMRVYVRSEFGDTVEDI